MQLPTRTASWRSNRKQSLLEMRVNTDTLTVTKYAEDRLLLLYEYTLQKERIYSQVCLHKRIICKWNWVRRDKKVNCGAAALESFIVSVIRVSAFCYIYSNSTICFTSLDSCCLSLFECMMRSAKRMCKECKEDVQRVHDEDAKSVWISSTWHVKNYERAHLNIRAFMCLMVEMQCSVNELCE